MIQDKSIIKEIVIPDDYPPVFLDSSAINRLRHVPNVSLTIYNDRKNGTEELIKKINNAHTLILTRSNTIVNSQVLEATRKSLKHIAILGTAIDNLNTEWKDINNLLITSTPDTHVESVAEHTLALMLSLGKRIPQMDQRVRNGEWPRSNIMLLRGKTLGIIGTGRVGETLKDIAEGIGMKVSTYSIQDTDQYSKSFEEILKSSDILSLHARLNQNTKHLIGSVELSLMKPTAFLINTARGSLINEKDLVTALENSTISGAALDVFEEEPISNSKLTRLSNVILSPHIAGSTEESLSITLNQVIDSVIDNIKL